MTTISRAVRGAALVDRSHVVWLRVATAAAILGAVLLRAWAPSDDASSTICFLRRCTGVSCPGCGMTRAGAHFLRGDWAGAWRNHPLVFVLVAEAVALAVVAALTRTGRLDVDWRRHATWLVAAHIPLFLGVWLVRALAGGLPA